MFVDWPSVAFGAFTGTCVLEFRSGLFFDKCHNFVFASFKARATGCKQQLASLCESSVSNSVKQNRQSKKNANFEII